MCWDTHAGTSESPRAVQVVRNDILKLGLIADIQYADCEDGTDYDKVEERHFRNALVIAKQAVVSWNEERVEAVIQLGDIIDGRNFQAGESEKAMAAVLSVLDECKAPKRYDLIGNHEMYNVKRKDLAASGLRCLGESGKTYYSASLTDKWEAVFLDSYEWALIGMDSSEEGYQKAVELMKVKNPAVIDPTNKDWFAGLSPEMHRYVPYNGGMSPEQVSWLEATLKQVAADNRKALVFSHVPLYEGATKPKTMVWNLEDVMGVLHQYKDCVAGVFAGHDHNGGYSVDAAGLHHITMNSPMTAPVGSDCWATLECAPDGTACFKSFGRACVESKTSGRGRVHEQIFLAPGAENKPKEGTQL